MTCSSSGIVCMSKRKQMPNVFFKAIKSLKIKRVCGSALGNIPEVLEEPMKDSCTAEVWHRIIWKEEPLGDALWLPFPCKAPHES